MRGLSTSNEPVRAAGRCAGGGPAVDWSLTFPDLPRLERRGEWLQATAAVTQRLLSSPYRPTPS